MTEGQTVEGRRYIVVVHDSAAVEFCPAELILVDIPDGDARGASTPPLGFLRASTRSSSAVPRGGP